MIDVDNFKTVNDLNGRVIGDEVLKNFGSILKESFTIEDIVGVQVVMSLLFLLKIFKSMEMR